MSKDNDDPYAGYGNVVDIHRWKKQKDVDDQEELMNSLDYFKQLLMDIVNDISPSQGTFHLPPGSIFNKSGSLTYYDDDLEFEAWDPMGEDDEDE